MGGLTLTALGAGTVVALGAIGSVLLVALYLLRERQRRAPVSFSPLWTQGLGLRRHAVVGRRLRRWLSFLLQLTVLGLLLLGAAVPRRTDPVGPARTLLLLVDVSASMRAIAGTETRMDLARRNARAVVASLRGGDRLMVAGFAAQVGPETGFENDLATLDQAIARLQPSEEATDAPRALAFAASALRGRANPIVVVIGDGDVDVDQRSDDIEVRFVPVAAAADNVAVLAFSVERRPADPTSAELRLALHNFGVGPRTVALELRAGVAKQLIERVPVLLAPGTRIERSFPWPSTDGAIIEAHLAFADGGRDALALDDQAFAVVPALPRRRLLVVGRPDLYLDGALLSLGASVTVRRVSAAAAETSRAAWASQDAVIFNGIAPAPPPTAGRFLYLGASGPGSPFGDRGLVRDPVASEIATRHPLLAHVSLADLNIREARRLAVEPGDESPVVSFGTPLLVTRRRDHLSVVALAFDPAHSDLPLRPAYPLLLANTLDWLGHDAAPVAPALRTGTSARIPLPRGDAATWVRVTDPAGVTVRRPALAGAVEVPVLRQGFHRIAPEMPGVPPVLVAANLASPLESDLRRTPRLRRNGEPQEPWDPTPAARPLPVSAAGLSLWLAAVLLIGEWWTFHRRWTV